MKPVGNSQSKIPRQLDFAIHSGIVRLPLEVKNLLTSPCFSLPERMLHLFSESHVNRWRLQISSDYFKACYVLHKGWPASYLESNSHLVHDNGIIKTKQFRANSYKMPVYTFYKNSSLQIALVQQVRQMFLADSLKDLGPSFLGSALKSCCTEVDRPFN